MSVVELETMKTSEKLMMIEEIWDDLLKKDSTSFELSPDWHLDTLQDREDKLNKNKTRFEDFETVKSELQSRV